MTKSASKRRPRALGGVVPPTPIINLRTGQVTHFGPRRAYDGAYVSELLRAKGIQQRDVEGFRFIARALGPEFDHLKIGYLDQISILFHEQMTEEDYAAMRAAGPNASAQKINGVLTITPADDAPPFGPRLRVVGGDHE
jgi:hypothetical protein